MAKKDDITQRDIGFQPGEQAKPFQSGKSWFLGIGIDTYSHFKLLNNAVKDVNDIRNVLVEKYDFEISNTELLCNEDATRENIIQKLYDYDRLPAEDRLLIYYSGHGHVIGKEKAQKGYWIPIDAVNGKIGGYINNVEIKEFIRGYEMQHFLLISDSCFSESLIRREVTKGISGAYPQWAADRSRYIFSSGKGVVSDGEPGKNSPFTSQILKYLKQNTGILDIVTLAEKVIQAVTWNYEQKAEYATIYETGHDGGRFLFIPKVTISPEVQDWKKACEENTMNSYHDFMVKYTIKSPYYKAAKSALEILEEEEIWDETKSKHTRLGYFIYLEKYPDGKYKSEANEALNIFKSRPTKDKISPEPLSVKPEAVSEKSPPAILQPKKIIPFEPEMVFVEGGKFMMGKDDKTKGHEVTLDNFFIGKYQVTQAQWKAIMGNNPSQFKGDELPVESVSWKDVQEFILKLNQKTGKKYRLPTEAEWEYAARGGNKSKGFQYSGSNNIDEVAWFWENSGDKRLAGSWDSDKIVKNNGRTHPVGQLKYNELGIFDMSGNVWEWCEDWYGDYPATPQINPPGPSSGSGRVVRGGSWFSHADYCRVSRRSNDMPDCRYNDLGFRLLRTE